MTRLLAIVIILAGISCLEWHDWPYLTAATHPTYQKKWWAYPLGWTLFLGGLAVLVGP